MATDAAPKRVVFVLPYIWTVHLQTPIANDTVTESGKPWGWTLSQRYTRLDKLTSGVTRTSQL
jgi:hypothetical protein